MSEAKQSDAMHLLQHVWAKTPWQSYAHINLTMQTALGLAIDSGMEFAPGDFTKYGGRFGFGHWGGENVEHWYSRAVIAPNLSAARSIEAHRKRQPFVYDRILRNRYTHIPRRGTKKHGRLAVGFEFAWKGETYTVTSFADNGESLTACSYKPKGDHLYPSKIKRRVKITIADLRANMKLRKAAANPQPARSAQAGGSTITNPQSDEAAQ